MHSLTFIIGRELYAVTTPCWVTSWMLHGILRSAGIRSRLWKHKNKQLRMLA